MNDVLKQAGYVIEPSCNVWCRPGYSGIAYNDGDEIEQRIAAVIRDASDITVLSTELRTHCTDWPSLYHLSSSRANILRPLEQSLAGDILEIGAGCGAITRYLGECGASVLALEGSPRRAAIARSRSRDLNNVTVLAEKFDQFECDRQFDVITLIGVLEYANLFTTSDNPAKSMLERVRALLKPDGKLIIAIENQLGLKYFAGAPEDHIGQPMYGIEGRYRKDQPQTFGRRALQTLLTESGFSQSAFMSPLPDYKLPASIVTEAGFSDPDFDAAALAWQSVRRDPQLPSIMSFSPELVWPVAAQNGLALDLANSFLIVASGSQVTGLQSDVLAYHYSTDRRPEFCKETVFIKRADGSSIKVACRLLSTSAHDQPQALALFRPEFNSTYTPGVPLSWEFIKIVSRDGWRIADAVDYFKRYLEILSKVSTSTGERIEIFTDETKKYVHGKFIDAIPQNIICQPNDVYRLIDREWQGREDISTSRVLFRSILLQIAGLTRFGEAGDPTDSNITRKHLIVELFSRLGFQKDINSFSDFLECEAAFQGMVTGRPVEEFMHWWPETTLPTENLDIGLLNRDRQIHTLNLSAIERDKQIHDLNLSAIERDKQIHDLNLSLTERDTHIQNLASSINGILNSTSWRISSPYRKLGKFVLSVKSVTSQFLSGIKHRGGLTRTATKALSIYRLNGIAGVKQGVQLLLGGATAGPANQSESHDRNDYTEWVRRYDTLTDSARAKMREIQRQFKSQPLISVVMPTFNPNPEWLVEAIESVRAQLYQNWELCVADDASTDPRIHKILKHYSSEESRIKVVFRKENGHISIASNSALEIATGQWIALLDHDDLLAEHALFWVADAINRNPDVGLIYSDEDKISETGERSDPYFKCAWNPDLFYSHNMICHLGVYKRELVKDIGGFRKGFEGAQDYDLALRYIEKLNPKHIRHIPKVLYHWRLHSQSTASGTEAKPYAMLAGERAINEHFARMGIKGKVTLGAYGFQPIYELPEPLPLVSIIIPTRNGLSLLKQCLESIFHKTTYLNYEVIVVDNGSDDRDTIQYLDNLSKSNKIMLIRDDSPFNYSALNNNAVAHARGEIVALINNDIEVISPDWLDTMVSHALRPEIGAVGARLWYTNKTLQHGGVILGIGGVAGHAHKHLLSGAGGYFSRAQLTQNFSAVTAACLVIRKETFEKVGGLDATNLSVAFNDVDFCLRVRELGFRNLWAPSAELFHHESATRGYEDSPEKQARFLNEVEYMKKRWGKSLLSDPAYSPNLTLSHEDFSYRWPPSIE